MAPSYDVAWWSKALGLRCTSSDCEKIKLSCRCVRIAVRINLPV